MPAAPPLLADLDAVRLFTPELVAGFAPALGISADVNQSIRTLVQETRDKLQKTQQDLRTDTATLSDMVNQPTPDSTACLDQLDKVLADKRAIKLRQPGTDPRPPRKLTPGQITRLKEFYVAMSNAERDKSLPEALRTKRSTPRPSPSSAFRKAATSLMSAPSCSKSASLPNRATTKTPTPPSTNS